MQHFNYLSCSPSRHFMITHVIGINAILVVIVLILFFYFYLFFYLFVSSVRYTGATLNYGLELHS